MMNTKIKLASIAFLCATLPACDSEELSKLSDRNGEVVLPGEEPEESEQSEEVEESEESDDQEESAQGKGDKGNKGKKAKKGKFACVRHHAYWKTHGERKKGKKPSVWPMAESTPLCGEGWMDVLNTPPNENLGFYKLAYQYVASQLNLALGAAPTEEVQTAIDEAGALLEACDKAAVDADDTRDLWKQLHAFNHGQTDHSCGEDTPDDAGEPESKKDPKKGGKPEKDGTPGDNTPEKEEPEVVIPE